VSLLAFDNPQTTSSITYTVDIFLTIANAALSVNWLPTGVSIGTNSGIIQVQEIMGANDNQPGIPALPAVA
jgi:hypothetical protein